LGPQPTPGGAGGAGGGNNRFPAPPRPGPININTESLDALIAQLTGGIQGAEFKFDQSFDPDLAALIQRIQGQLGNTKTTIDQLLQQANTVGSSQFAPGPNFQQQFKPGTFDPGPDYQQQFTPGEFEFDDSQFASLREQIAALLRGEGVGDIDIEGDPEAAAFRNARERQAARERSALAERGAATGFNRTGGFDAAVAGGAGDAGRDIAGFEASLAGRRRGELLDQKLQGAQLGLADLQGTRQSALGAFNTEQQAGLAGEQQRLDAFNAAGQNRMNAFNTEQQAGLANEQNRFQQFQADRDTRQRSFENQKNNQLQSLALGLSGAQGQFGTQQNDLLQALQQRTGNQDFARQQQFAEFQSNLANQQNLLGQSNQSLQDLRNFGLNQNAQSFSQQQAFFNSQIQALEAQSRLATSERERELLDAQIDELRQRQRLTNEAANRPTFQNSGGV